MTPQVLESAPAVRPSERRREPRSAVIGTLWMIDNRTATVLRCRCVDAAPNGMRLRVPVGYGVHQGQCYELCSHLPGQSTPPGLGFMISRRARVMYTHVLADDPDYGLEVGVALDADRAAYVDETQDETTNVS